MYKLIERDKFDALVLNTDNQKEIVYLSKSSMIGNRVINDRDLDAIISELNSLYEELELCRRSLARRTDA